MAESRDRYRTYTVYNQEQFDRFNSQKLVVSAWLQVTDEAETGPISN